MPQCRSSGPSGSASAASLPIRPGRSLTESYTVKVPLPERSSGQGAPAIPSTIESYIYKESALEVKAQLMPEARTYLLMVRGGALPYDVVASYDVPKEHGRPENRQNHPFDGLPRFPGLGSCTGSPISFPLKR